MKTLNMSNTKKHDDCDSIQVTVQRKNPDGSYTAIDTSAFIPPDAKISISAGGTGLQKAVD
jgi:hypothetical protein